MNRVLFLLVMSCALAAEIIRPDSIREGMKGTGYTVMHGTNIERFDVTVLGVLKKHRGRADSILVKVEGLSLDRSGIIAGMSGSPVYFDGKLAGAVAFGWAYNKDASGGVTPIEEMTKLFDRPTGSGFGYEPFRTTNTSSAYGEKPVSSPLMLSGFSPEVLSLYADSFRDKGFLPLTGGGTVQDDTSSGHFLPGDACAVTLMEGDLNAVGVGTVTYSDEKRFLIFGHSMLMKGALNVPVSSAYIHAVIPSQQISFKLGAAFGKPLGITTYDGEFGLAGAYGRSASLLVPVTISVEKAGQKRVTAVRIVPDPSVFPDFAGSALLSSLVGEGLGESVTVSLSLLLETDYKRTLCVSNLYLSYRSLEAYKAAVQDALYPVQLFMFNRFRPLSVKRLAMDVSIRNELSFSAIDELRTDASEYEPGDTVRVRVWLRPNGGEREFRDMTFVLPDIIRPGSYTVYAGGDMSFEQFQRTYFPRRYTPKSIDEMFDILSRPADARALNVWLFASVKGVLLNGNEFERLPSSYYGMLSQEPTTEKSALMSSIRSRTSGTNVILGNESIQIRVTAAKE